MSIFLANTFHNFNTNGDVLILSINTCCVNEQFYIKKSAINSIHYGRNGWYFSALLLLFILSVIFGILAFENSIAAGLAGLVMMGVMGYATFVVAPKGLLIIYTSSGTYVQNTFCRESHHEAIIRWFMGDSELV